MPECTAHSGAWEIEQRMDKARGSLKAYTTDRWGYISISRHGQFDFGWDACEPLANQLARALGWLCFEHYGRRKTIMLLSWVVTCPRDLYIGVLDAMVDLNNGNVVKAERMLQLVLLGEYRGRPDWTARQWIVTGEGHWR